MSPRYLFGNVRLHILLLCWHHSALNDSARGSSLLVAITVDKKHWSLLQHIEFSTIVVYYVLLYIICCSFQFQKKKNPILMAHIGLFQVQVRYPDGPSFSNLWDGDESIREMRGITCLYSLFESSQSAVMRRFPIDRSNSGILPMLAAFGTAVVGLSCAAQQADCSGDVA